MKTSRYFVTCALLLLDSTAAAQCSLCPGGSAAIGSSNAALLPGTEDATCGEKEALAAAASEAACSDVVNNINAGIDYSAFCCIDVQPKFNSCPFCEGISIDVNTAFPRDLSDSITTCGQAKTLAQYIYTNSAACPTITNSGPQTCCKAPTMAPTKVPTITRPPTPFPTPRPSTRPPTPLPTPRPTSGLTMARCSLCPGGSAAIGSSNAALLPGTKDATCGEKEALAAAASEATCSDVVNNINAGIDYSAFCCIDVQPKFNSCPFCEGISIDVNQVFPPDFSSSITTCGQAKTLAQYIYANDDFACSTIANIGTDSCCKAPTMAPTKLPTITRLPTPFPTPRPPPPRTTRPSTTQFPSLKPTPISTSASTMVPCSLWCRSIWCQSDITCVQSGAASQVSAIATPLVVILGVSALIL